MNKPYFLNNSFLLTLLILLGLSSCNQPTQEPPADDNALETNNSGREYYQIKIYEFADKGQEERTDAHIAEAMIPALHRQGLNDIGVFKPVANEEDTIGKTYLLIPFSSLVQMATYEKNLIEDDAYQQTGAEYLDAAYDQPNYLRKSSIILLAFEDMPQHKLPALEGPRSERIYELRSYESSSENYYRNKVKMFNAGGEVTLFDDLKFNAVFYGEVISGPNMPNLMYMTTHENKEIQASNWQSFIHSPVWEALSAKEEYQHNVSHIDIVLLYPTEFSDY